MISEWNDSNWFVGFGIDCRDCSRTWRESSCLDDVYDSG